MGIRTITATSTAAVAATAAALLLAVPGTEAAGTKTVKVDDYRFAPASLSVKTGTKVRFVWAGDAFHDVSIVSGPSRATSPVKRSGTWTKTFKKRGTYRIECSIHSMVMRMTVRVR